MLHRVERHDGQIRPADAFGHCCGGLPRLSGELGVMVGGGCLREAVRPERLGDQQPDAALAVAGADAFQAELEIRCRRRLRRDGRGRPGPAADRLERAAAHAGDSLAVLGAALDERVGGSRVAAPRPVAHRRIAIAVPQRLERGCLFGRGVGDLERRLRKRTGRRIGGASQGSL